MTENNIIINTNFILCYLLANNKVQHQIANEFFRDLKPGKIKASLEQAVIIEVIFVLSSYYKVLRDRIVNVLSNFLKSKGLIIYEQDNISKSLELYAFTKLHIFDYLLATESIILI